MGEWTVAPLESVLAFREGPGILAKDFHAEGVPLVRLAGLKRGADLLEGCNYLDPEKVEAKWKQFRLRDGDVLLSTSASLGEVATVTARGAGAIPYTGIIGFRPKDERVHKSFVRFLLADTAFKAQIEAMGVGSVMKHFGPSHLRQMTVRFPDRSEQVGIAEVVGALDDKIAANDKVISRSQELAAMTWLRATRAQGSDFVPLSSLARFVNGRAYTKDATGTGRVVIRIAELNSGIGGSTVYNDIEVPADNVARPGDLLFAWSGSLTVARWHRPEAIINQHIFKVVPVAGRSQWLVEHALRDKLAEFQAVAADKATTMGHIQRRHLDEPVSIPGQAEAGLIGPQMEALTDQVASFESENLVLARTRDQLLPLLMSGKVTVKDAENELDGMV